MRKHTTYLVFVALLLTVAFSSCRREPLPENAILFSVGPEVNVEAATKAGSPADQGYSAIKLYGGKLSAGATDKVSFFGADGSASSTTLTRSGSAWTYDPIKYWEHGATYDFRAVYPAEADIVEASSTSVEIDYNSLGTNTASVYSGNYDLMVATAQDQTTQTTKVPLQFHHACAAVGFVFTKSGNVSADCKVTSLKLKDVYTSGTLTYTSTTEDAAVTNSDWTVPTSTTETWPLSSAEWAVPTSVQWYFVVPQPLSGISVEYTYVCGTDAPKTVPPIAIPNKDSNNNLLSWVPGKAYVYTIDIAMSKIDVQIEPWDVYSVWVTDIPFPDK